MPYKFERFYNNLEKRIFPGVGSYDIPVIRAEQYKPVKFIGFNYANQCRDYSGKGVHFYLDDYQFERIWTKFDRNINMLAKFDAVLSPDWSIYRDWPVAVQIWNHYRKHYIAAYLQSMGVTVYPSISWSDKSSFDWCFDGEPVGGCVSVSSVGTQLEKEAVSGFLYGYNMMMDKLNPSAVLFYGIIPDGCYGNIIKIEEFQKRLRSIDTNGDVM